MDMVYMKLYWDDLDLMEALSDAERGRLLTAALKYGRSGEMVSLSGNERILIPALRMRIDRDRTALQAEESKAHEIKASAGRKGGQARASRAKQTQAKPSKSSNNTNTNTDTNTEDETNTGDIPPVSPPAFERFWAAYPKKQGKGAAQKAFERITGVPVDVMLYAIEQQRHSRQWQRDNGQYIPYPATWLNQRRWEDEPETQALPQSSGNIFADLAREFEQEESNDTF